MPNANHIVLRPNLLSLTMSVRHLHLHFVCPNALTRYCKIASAICGNLNVMQIAVAAELQISLLRSLCRICQT